MDIIRYNTDMVIFEFVYRDEFRFQRLLKDYMWYVTYNNYIIAHGMYRHDLIEWIDMNYF